MSDTKAIPELVPNDSTEILRTQIVRGWESVFRKTYENSAGFAGPSFTIRVLDDLFESFRHQGIRFVIAGVQEQPAAALAKAGRFERYGRENFAVSLDDALARASGETAAAS